jgi:sterol desaturase/sphingolipid hydroxylase (fatty acid hydroxylase superfamily)
MDTVHPVGRTTRRAADGDRTPALGTVAREHLHRPTVWVLAGLTVAALAARLAVGGWTRGDALLVVLQVGSFPLVEWVLHTALLHWRPRRVGSVTLDPLVARKHREHHADPRDPDLVFIPMPTLVLAVAATLGIGLLAFPRPGLGLTFVLVQGLLGSVYEWTHHLVHTDYRPRTRLVRAIRTHHRLHHYKNERYWFTVTTSGTADRLLRTAPHPSQVPTSPTARDLHGLEASSAS